MKNFLVSMFLLYSCLLYRCSVSAQAVSGKNDLFETDEVLELTLKGNVKTNISGEVESMICNDKVCMPPTTEKFNVALN